MQPIPRQGNIKLSNRNRQTIRLRDKPPPPSGRAKYEEYEWKLIKESIDSCRVEVDDNSAELLRAYNLWDDVNDVPDDEEITNLYMEYT